MIEIYFDGSCGPTNPDGDMGVGVVVKENGQIIDSYSAKITRKDFGKTTTNNVAEYCAFLKALELAGKHNKKCTIMGDSKLVIDQMRGFWKIKFGAYSELAHEAKEIYESMLDIVHRIKWIPREENTEADALSTGNQIKRVEGTNEYTDYEWRPLRDITTYELAVCMGYLMNKKPISIYDIQSRKTIFRHFFFK